MNVVAILNAERLSSVAGDQSAVVPNMAFVGMLPQVQGHAIVRSWWPHEEAIWLFVEMQWAIDLVQHKGRCRAAQSEERGLVKHRYNAEAISTVDQPLEDQQDDQVHNGLVQCHLCADRKLEQHVREVHHRRSQGHKLEAILPSNVRITVRFHTFSLGEEGHVDEEDMAEEEEILSEGGAGRGRRAMSEW